MKIELYRTPKGFRWRLRGANGQITAGHSQQPYNRKANMLKTLAGIFGDQTEIDGQPCYAWRTWPWRRGKVVWNIARVVDLTKKGVR